MTKLTLFWHRRDLRLSDNLGLAAACQQTPKVVGVFCFDPQILDRDDIAPPRVTYMIGCLQELEESYHQVGTQLLILHDEPQLAIPRLAEVLKATKVIWNLDIEPLSRTRDEKVTERLQAKGIQVETYWDQLLHPPGEVLTKSETPYTVYTPFWKNWSQQPKQNIASQPTQLQGLTPEELALAQQTGVIPLPTAKELGYHWPSPLVLEPGETKALERLGEFCTYNLSEYQQQRNFPALDGTSRLSAALKFGAIGIRTIWQATVEAAHNSNSEEESASIKTWQQELAWREFYQHCLYFFPELAYGPYREQFKDFPWQNNEDRFQAWCEGKTGYPMVDAAMRQLNETGWMHNRCRMIVASFLTKDLIIDWRWGEKYFMQKLSDGDLAANNGGWQWSASSGMDPKPLRIFNPASQAQKFDPEAEYIRQWLPEISSLDPEYLVTGKIPPLECHSCNYPQPIVDHKKQQQEFKLLYKLSQEK
jgi:deoxyribodipyrimidine photo-lyase